MGSQEAMDSAQLGRNIATGKGYTTGFIRPFSMFLLQRQNAKRMPQGTRLGELTKVADRHPDISNAPVYPYVLAGLMKVLPFRYPIPEKDLAQWSMGVAHYQPDVLISIFNQTLFFLLIVSTFFLARRLFDAPTAWLSAALLFGADIMWRFSVSGLSTMLLLLIFSGVVWCLVLIEETVREGNRGLIGLVVLLLLLGIACGLGILTRYSCGWMIIPIAIFLVLLPRRDIPLPGAQQLGREIFVPSRAFIWSIPLIVFFVLTVPWIIRNYHLSGAPFGTASYFMYDGTAHFPENRLDRALQPEFPAFNTNWLTVLAQKLFNNTRSIVENDLLRLGGGFIAMFFFIGLLIPLNNPGPSRLRWFLVGSLPVLVIVQALGHTHLSDDSPNINMENMLVLLAPFVIIFGVQFFWMILGQLQLPFHQLRYVFVAGFCLVTCLPLLFTFLPPKPPAVVYPPYFPPSIQRAASFVEQDELAMCDISWAMAWYGNVRSILATEGTDAYATIDEFQPIKELYLTQATINRPFLSGWMQSSDNWGNLFLQFSTAFRDADPLWPKEVRLTLNRINGSPSLLPIHYMQAGWPRECLITSRKNPIPK
jgi:4-amino-4-deoxy-L-arabinose transferase-like glycosyltransferase